MPPKHVISILSLGLPALWPALDNPWMHQQAGGNRLMVQAVGKKVIYDLDRWEKTELTKCKN